METPTRMTVPCEIMRKIYVPMLDDVWAVGGIGYEDVRACPSLKLGTMPHDKITDQIFYTREYHIARIAWLGKHGWEEGGEHAIELHLGEEGVYLFDGNHRFSAALVFHDSITFDFYGDEEEFAKILDKAKNS